MERGYRADRGAGPRITRINLRLDLPVEIRRLLDLYVCRLSALQGKKVTTSDTISAMVSYLMMALAPELLGAREELRVDQLHSLLKTLDPKDLEKIDVFRDLAASAAPSGDAARAHTAAYDNTRAPPRTRRKASKRRTRRRPRAEPAGAGPADTTTQAPPGPGTPA